jgi:uncharacterized protein YkwD
MDNEKPVRAIGGLLILAILASVLVSAIIVYVAPAPAQTNTSVESANSDPPSPEPVPVEEQYYSQESQLNKSLINSHFYDLVNEERQEQNRTTLTKYQRIDNISRYHASDLAETGDYSHTSPNGLSVEDRHNKYAICESSGENIGWGTFERPNRLFQDTNKSEEVLIAEFIFKNLVGSKGHYENMLNEAWNTTGVGVATDGENTVVIVQNFCKKRPTQLN